MSNGWKRKLRRIWHHLVGKHRCALGHTWTGLGDGRGNCNARLGGCDALCTMQVGHGNCHSCGGGHADWIRLPPGGGKRGDPCPCKCPGPVCHGVCADPDH